MEGELWLCSTVEPVHRLKIRRSTSALDLFGGTAVKFDELVALNNKLRS